MPVSPSCVSGISACHFRICTSFNELWIFLVGPATFKYRTVKKSETQEHPPQCKHSFQILSWNSASWPPLFLPPYCCTSLCKYLTLWKLQSIALEPRYSEKVMCLSVWQALFLLLCHFGKKMVKTMFPLVRRKFWILSWFDFRRGLGVGWYCLVHYFFSL